MQMYINNSKNTQACSIADMYRSIVQNVKIMIVSCFIDSNAGFCFKIVT